MKCVVGINVHELNYNWYLIRNYQSCVNVSLKPYQITQHMIHCYPVKLIQYILLKKISIDFIFTLSYYYVKLSTSYCIYYMCTCAADVSNKRLDDTGTVSYVYYNVKWTSL